MVVNANSYTVKKGDCAWKVAENNLKQDGKKSISTADIVNEMNRLANLNGCKSVDDFNKNFFSKLGVVIKLGKSTSSQTSNDTSSPTMSRSNTLKTDTVPIPNNKAFVASNESTRVVTVSTGVINQRPPMGLGDKNWDNVQAEQNRINALPTNKDRIIAWNRTFNKDSKDNYIIVDKQAFTATVYSPDGKVIKSYEIGAAKNISDDLLVRSKTNPENNFASTTAGIYTANYRATGKDAYSKLYNDRVLTLSNDALRERGVGNGETGVALHQVPNGNKKRIDMLKAPGSSVDNNRFSDGCVNFLPEDFDDCMTHITGVGTKVYILPEDDNNYMTVKNGKLQFVQKKYTGKVPTTVTTNDQAKDIRISLCTQNITGEAKENSLKMAKALADNKQNLMKELKIDNDTYNEMAKLVLGIAGQESNYGDSSKYKFKENYQGIVNITKAIKGDNSSNSRGITQMKINSYNKEVSDLLKSHGITEDTLQDPNKCAIGTLIVLAKMYKDELPSIKTKMEAQNVSKMDALLYCWNGKKSQITNGTATPSKNIYIKNVRQFMSNFNIYQS